MSIIIYINKTKFNNENILNQIKSCLKKNKNETNILYLFSGDSKNCINLSEEELENNFNFNVYLSNKKFKKLKRFRSNISVNKCKDKSIHQLYYDECSSDAVNSEHFFDEEMEFEEQTESDDQLESEEQTEEEIESDEEIESEQYINFKYQADFVEIVKSQQTDQISKDNDSEDDDSEEQSELIQQTGSSVIIDLEQSSNVSSQGTEEEDDSIISDHEDNPEFFESDESYIPENDE